MAKFCTRYLNGSNCSRFCPFSHQKEDAPLCISWTKGFCIGSRGNACRWRHFYQESDRPVLQPASSGNPRPVTIRDEEFSSPLVLKVRREVARERREEVDLETGKRRSWVETKEFEVLDLTGDSPVSQLKLKKPPLRESRLTSEGKVKVNKLDVKCLGGSPVSNRKPLSPINNTIKSTVNNTGQETADPNVCPACERTFKGQIGVKLHQRKTKNIHCRKLS